MNLNIPHRRFNPLTREWILVSPHRARRPWLGQVEKVPPENLPSYDPTCYLCPGNARVGGVINPNYSNTFVFDNDFQALLTPDVVHKEDFHIDSVNESHEKFTKPNELFQAKTEFGLSRVVCFSPLHNQTLPEMEQSAVEQVIRTWSDQTQQIGEMEFISYIQIFENKGAMMGASNPHPHSQIWASSQIPTEIAKELASQAEYMKEEGSCLVCDVLLAEQKFSERIVVTNEYFSVLVPFWAVWPFETLLISHRHITSFLDLTENEISGLADIMRRLTILYDNLFEISFPYSMGFHQSPKDRMNYPFCHFHAHYYPPLLRSATVRKFMVGYEMLAMPQRDLTPELAANRLRDQKERHYKSQVSNQESLTT